MDYELFVKIGTLCLGLIGAAKIFQELSNGRRSRMREEYKFAREFLGDVVSNRDMHPFLKEKGFQAIAGDNRMSADEIEYLLSLTGPERALRDYVKGMAYLEHLPQSGNLQIKFKKKFESKWSRQWRLWLYVVFYGVFALMAFSPWLLASFSHVSLAKMLSAMALTIPVFLTYAWFSLKAGARIYRAQKLVKDQNRHTQTIVLPLPARSYKEQAEQR
jgi:hypothetical protein